VVVAVAAEEEEQQDLMVAGVQPAVMAVWVFFQQYLLQIQVMLVAVAVVVMQHPLDLAHLPPAVQMDQQEAPHPLLPTKVVVAAAVQEEEVVVLVS
jgi:hypothetical protein